MVEPTKTNSAVAWIALIFSILALFIGITAYNRSGQNLVPTISEQTQRIVKTDQVGEVVEEETEEVSETDDQLAARAEAVTALLGVRADIVADNVTEETEEKLQEVRLNLREAYVDADMELTEQYEELDNNLETLETQLREDSDEALATMDNILEWLRRDALTD